MTVTPTPRQSMQYPDRTITRAERAMRCAPFRLQLFTTMIQQSVALQAIAQTGGTDGQYTTKPLSELAVEQELMWLIQVGLLRREVDGQGLTDSFRVTPLGRQLAEQWQREPGRDHAPSWRDRLYNALNRWLRLSI
ncbi:Npun_F0494 family protein [Pantanalinema rosaneae CENA516]|uniref:Npun_F0494 family protein n=1 Tax=Pantanalinema rosaneae TaxID=1620701 RepID=UPI003D6FF9AF